jgi:heme/copper-type cytochrome/quinol oxidase subunit 4
MSREEYDEGARMNSVVFGIIIAVLAILTILLIQKVLDSPNH